MNIIDLLLIVLLALVLFFAVRRVVRNRGKCSCGCDGCSCECGKKL